MRGVRLTTPIMSDAEVKIDLIPTYIIPYVFVGWIRTTSFILSHYFDKFTAVKDAISFVFRYKSPLSIDKPHNKEKWNSPTQGKQTSAI
jgi:hypothetical protein